MTLKIILLALQLFNRVVTWLERQRWKAEGRREHAAEQKAKQDALQAHYDEIDARPSSLDDAIDGLRNRANSGGRKRP